MSKVVVTNREPRKVVAYRCKCGGPIAHVVGPFIQFAGAANVRFDEDGTPQFKILCRRCNAAVDPGDVRDFVREAK